MNYRFEYDLFKWMKYDWHIVYLYAKSLLQFFRTDEKSGSLSGRKVPSFTYSQIYFDFGPPALNYFEYTIIELASIEQSLNRIGGKHDSESPVSDYMSLHLFMLIIWTKRMHHWPCLTRNQVRYDAITYIQIPLLCPKMYMHHIFLKYVIFFILFWYYYKA